MSIVTDDLSGIDGPTLQDADVPARTVVLSAHGGSGATTVASHLGLPEVGAVALPVLAHDLGVGQRVSGSGGPQAAYQGTV